MYHFLKYLKNFKNAKIIYLILKYSNLPINNIYLKWVKETLLLKTKGIKKLYDS